MEEINNIEAKSDGLNQTENNNIVININTMSKTRRKRTISTISNNDESTIKVNINSTEMDYLFAGQLVIDARDIRNLTFKKTEHHLKMYKIFLDKRITFALKVIMFIQLMLPLIEKPYVINAPYWLASFIELICIIIYFIRWFHLSSFEVESVFRKDKKNFVILGAILVTINH
jgi:lipopolysaccharide export LptBFGC system permease protein LptF